MAPQRPPRTRRCAGTYGPKYKTEAKVGQQCERMITDDQEFCARHRPLEDHERCIGHYSKNHETKPGERCTQPRMHGQTVCYKHGGNAPQARAAAARRIAEAKVTEQIERQLAGLDVGPIDNPLTALSQLAGQVVAWQEALSDRVNALTEIRYQGGAGEQLRAEIALYERAMDRCNTVLGTIARLNIDERLAKVSEQQAEKILTAIDALLLHLGISGDQAVDAKKFLARRLRSA